MISTQGLVRLATVAERLKAEQSVEPITVREFLSWFDTKRRGYWVVIEIKEALVKAGLTTDPDFESAYIDAPIQLLLSTPSAASSPTINSGGTQESKDDASPTQPIDPTHRISKLAAANNAPVCVNPDAALSEATTLMLVRGFSQLPVMTNSRDVKGVISWQSIGSRLGAGIQGSKVREMMDEQHNEVRHDASLFQAIPAIVANDYILVRGRDNTITGIVTASDLSLQFLQLSEPFLLLSEIENYIRQIIAARFSVNEISAAQDPRDEDRTVERVADLTLGEYIRLLERPENWKKSGLPWDRAVFCETLSKVRDIRNEVMHFEPDPIIQADLDALREFARFLQRISTLSTTTA